MLGRAAALLFVFSVACNAPTEGDTERLGQTKQAIIAGTESDPSEDATVMVVLVDVPNNRRIGICSGTLVAPRLVVTARHCVAQTNERDPITCNEDGTPISGGQVGPNFDPGSFAIFTGNTRPQFIGVAPPELDMVQWKPAALVQEVIDDQASTLCSHDIALLMLKTPINGPQAPVRLDGDAAANEKVLTVGWGVTVPELEPSKRQQRGDVVIDRVGPDPSYPLLTKTEFSFGESICLGDSGGPVFDQQTKALIGVVSRGGNGETDLGGASTCLDARNLATKVSSFKPLLMDAFNRTGARPVLEDKPDDGGCSMTSHGRQSGSGAPFALLLVGVLSLARRIRSKHGASSFIRGAHLGHYGNHRVRRIG